MVLFFMVGFLFAYQIFLRNYKFFRISFELSHPLMFSYFLLLFNSDLLITVVLPSLKILLYKCCCGEGDFNKNCYPTRYFQAKIGRSFQLQFWWNFLMKRASCWLVTGVVTWNSSMFAKMLKPTWWDFSSFYCWYLSVMNICCNPRIACFCCLGSWSSLISRRLL